MKFLKFLAVCLFAVLSGLYVLSCSSDDDASSSPLLGTWGRTTKTSGYSEYIMFCTNNIGYEFEECSSHDYDVEKIEYAYNENTGKLTIISHYYNDSDTYEVLSLSSSKMILQRNSRTYTYEKVNSPCSEAQLDKLDKEQNASSDYSY